MRAARELRKRTRSPIFPILKPSFGCQFQPPDVTSHAIITCNCHSAHTTALMVRVYCSCSGILDILVTEQPTWSMINHTDLVAVVPLNRIVVQLQARYLSLAARTKLSSCVGEGNQATITHHHPTPLNILQFNIPLGILCKGWILHTNLLDPTFLLLPCT